MFPIRRIQFILRICALEERLKIRASTLDDLLRETYRRLIRTGRVVNPNRGEALEATGVLIELTNPRARISHSEKRHLLFSCLGELLWYLAGDNTLSFIRYYAPKYPSEGDGNTLRAAYGPRLRTNDKDRLVWVVEMLLERPDTRRAVIPIYSEVDAHTGLLEVPCTCTLQFLLRYGRLELLVHMRSNDAYIGLPHDVFAFTMIQEIIARSLNVEIGTYKHLVGSLHLYEKDRGEAERFLAEGFLAERAMPPMPDGDQFESIASVLEIEKALRFGHDAATPISLPDYWKDVVRLLRIYQADKKRKPGTVINGIRAEMHSDIYKQFIQTKYLNALRILA